MGVLAVLEPDVLECVLGEELHDVLLVFVEALPDVHEGLLGGLPVLVFEGAVPELLDVGLAGVDVEEEEAVLLEGD